MILSLEIVLTNNGYNNIIVLVDKKQGEIEDMKKSIYLIITLIIIGVGLFLCRGIISNKKEDYSFDITDMKIGTKNIYVEYNVGKSIDEKNAAIENLIISDGEKKLNLGSSSMAKTDKKNSYIEYYYLPSNFNDKSDEEITEIVNGFVGKEIEVEAKVFAKNNKKDIKCKKSFKINKLMEEKIQEVNTPFSVDDDVVILKKAIFDEKYITLEVEGENDIDTFILFELKGDDGKVLTHLGGDDTEQRYENKKDLKTIKVVAYKMNQDVKEGSMEIEIPVK